jgi:hypothetical protein
MENSANTSTQFIDIVSPAMPTTTGYLDALFLVVGVVLLFFGLLVLWRRYHSASQVALRRLKGVNRALQGQQLTPRMTGYLIAALLKQYLQLHHLSPTVTLPAPLHSQQSRWYDFLLRLHQVRYAPQTYSAEDMQILIAETRFWLRRWP